MTRLVSIVGLGFALSAGASAPLWAADTVPTFTKDVAPIVFNRCASCHRPGEVAPMSLLTYNQVRPWVKSIVAKITSREMPPWGADPRYGTFSNDHGPANDASLDSGTALKRHLTRNLAFTVHRSLDLPSDPFIKHDTIGL